MAVGMLRILGIENYGIIERAELRFDEGFTVLSGESGSGKTMILDALACVLGERWDPRRMGPFQSKSRLSATFELGSDHPLWDDLADWNLDPDDYLIVTREIQADRSLFRVQGQAVPAQTLRDLRERLVAMTGQHASLRLLQPEMLREWLDRFAGLAASVEAVREAYQAWRSLMERQQAVNDALPDPERLAEMEATVREIDALELKPGEDEEIARELNRVRLGKQLMQSYETVRRLLDGESGGGIVAELGAVEREVRMLARLDPAAEPVLNLFEEAATLLTEAGDQLAHWAVGLDWDASRVEWLEARSDLLARAKRRFGPTIDEVLDFESHLKQELDQAAAVRLDHDALEGKIVAAEEHWRRLAEGLTQEREQAAREASLRVSERIAELEMLHTRVEFTVSEDRPSASGKDRVTGWIGQGSGEPKPIDKMASGGELARIALAMTSLAGEGIAPTLVFDEVDAGLGGVAAARVGQLLRSLGEKAQVIAVSHQPSVAARAQHQWVVRKRTSRGIARSTVEAALGETRVREIARMLSGRQDEVALSHAQQLLIEGEHGGQAAL